MSGHAAPRKTPLASRHEAAGAKMVDFHGWWMPIQYRSIIAEHTAVRTTGGLFDVSHMGQVTVEGPGAGAFLQALLPTGLGRLVPGRALYSMLLNDAGGIIDDLLVYRLAADRYLLCINAGNVEADVPWIMARAEGAAGDAAGCTVRNLSDDCGMIALQGPVAETVAVAVAGAAAIPYYGCAEVELLGRTVLLSRTGYTGEDGFEFTCPADITGGLWDRILAAGAPHGLEPVGLGARDTLRLEARMPLHGNDMDDTVTPYEAGLGFAVDLEKPEPFPGKEALAAQKRDGVPRRTVALKLTGRGVPRAGCEVTAEGAVVGVVTSGTQSPTLNAGIALARIAAGAAEASLAIRIRRTDIPAERVKGPFVPHRVKREPARQAPA